MSLSLEILKELENKLLEEQKQLENELALILQPSFDGNKVVAFSEMGSGEDENASEIEQYTDSVALNSSLEKQLKEINESLLLIKKGVYGICEKCGTQISQERRV